MEGMASVEFRCMWVFIYSRNLVAEKNRQLVDPGTGAIMNQHRTRSISTRTRLVPECMVITAMASESVSNKRHSSHIVSCMRTSLTSLKIIMPSAEVELGPSAPFHEDIKSHDPLYFPNGDIVLLALRKIRL
jgi:hypothetical protein